MTGDAHLTRLRADLPAALAREHKQLPPGDLPIELLPDGIVPGHVVFRACYTQVAAKQPECSGGLVTPSGELLLNSARALWEVFRAWERQGASPAAIDVARVTVFLRGGYVPVSLIASPADVAELPAAWRALGAAPPRAIDPLPGGGPPGVELWQLSGPSLLRVRVHARGDLPPLVRADDQHQLRAAPQ